MKKISVLIVVFLLTICSVVSAKENDEVLLAQTVKYYKTTSIKDNSGVMSKSINNEPFLQSITVEISQSEYDNNSDIALMSNTVETTYKKMVTSIYSYNGAYRYKVNLKWKNMPSKRSYDIIAIGFPASVKLNGTPLFDNYYCVTSTNCYTSTAIPYYYSGQNGVGVTFALPTGNLVSMNQTLTINIMKNTNSTISRQYAYGDYSHATSTITLTNAKKYSVDTGGITLQNSIYNYYDAISTAEATWTGTW